MEGFHLRPVTSDKAELRMLSVCRIEKNKRIDWILQSLAELEHAGPSLSSRVDWRLDLVGKGSLVEPLRAMSNSLGIGNRIHFHGFLSDDDLESLYAKAHLFLMPAVQGYGIPGIEALQRGIPILLHRESGVSDILQTTAWATVLCGGREATTAALSSAFEGVISGKHHTSPLPDIPTEEQWAEQVTELCHWK
jgi:glycosyltransferase involved in cell wall biosynthesis